MPSSKPTAKVKDSKSEPHDKTTKAKLQYLTTAEVYKPLSQKLRRERCRSSGALAASSTSTRTKLPPEARQRQHRVGHLAEPGKVEQVEPASSSTLTVAEVTEEPESKSTWCKTAVPHHSG